MLFTYSIWFDGYKNCKLETPVYTAAAVMLKKCKDMEIRIFSVNKKWSGFQHKILSKTSNGDINRFLDNRFDSSEGLLNEKKTFINLLAKVKASSESTLFMTSSVEDAHAAKATGDAVLLIIKG